MYKGRSSCRNCGCDGMIVVLDLGNLYPSTFVDSTGEAQKAPLVLVRCEKCSLVQLQHTVDLDLMYRQYWYKSGLNDSMVRSLQDVVDNIEERIALKPGDVVIDIGCNDGTMLSLYTEPELFKVGIDPAYNLAEDASKKCDLFINDYFTSRESLPPELPLAKVVTAIAVFYDLEDPNGFLRGVKDILHPGGLFVVQFMDLYSMLGTSGFDNICHEHLEYYSLGILYKMFQDNGLRIYDVTYDETNGGSLRAYAVHKEDHKTPTVGLAMTLAIESEHLREDSFDKFRSNVERTRRLITEFIRGVGGVVAVMGASTKGNTLLQYFGLNYEDIDHAAEVNEDKFGKITIGSEIPIISQEESLRMNPDYYLILPWHFIKNFIGKHQDYLNRGGKFIIPLPEPAIVTMKEGQEVWTYLGKV